MKQDIMRGIVSILVFAVIFFLSGFLIEWTAYDGYIKAIEFLAAVVGAGCYWIGSRRS